MDLGNVSRTASSAYGDLEYDSTSPYESSINGERDRIAAALLTDRRSRNMAPGHVRSCTPAIKAEMSLLIGSRSPISAVPSQLANALSPTCRSTVFIELSRKSIAERENQRLKKIGHESREVYNWAGVGLRSTDSHSMQNKSSRSINSDAVSKRDPSISSSMKQWKTDRLNRSKAELRLLEEEALNRRANQYDAQIQKIKFRKNLDSFRKRLKERLIKVDDPLIGDVMRCVDYSMVHYILESHKDLNLTVDATLDSMGFPKEKKRQSEPRTEAEEIKYCDLVDSPSAIDSGSWDMLPDSSLCSNSHVDADSMEYSFHGPKTLIPWGMGGEHSSRNKRLLGKSFSKDAGTKYWNLSRNASINVTQKELSLRAFAEASSNGELKVVNNSNDIVANRDEYPTSKDDWRVSRSGCLLTQRGSLTSQSLPCGPLSDRNILNSLDRDNVSGDDYNNTSRNKGFPPTIITTHYVFRRSSTSSSTSTSTSYSSSTGNESEASNEKDNGSSNKSVIFITAGDCDSPSLAPTSFPFPAISPSSKFNSSAASGSDNDNNSNISKSYNSNRSENKNEITVGNVGDGNMPMRGNGRTVRILSFSDEIDDEATSSRGSVNGSNGSSKTSNVSNNMNDYSSSSYASFRDTHGYIETRPNILEAGSGSLSTSTPPSPTTSSSGAILRDGKKNGDIHRDRDIGHKEGGCDEAVISTHVMWTTATAPPLPAPSTLSLPISNTPSHPVVLTSLNPRNKITKTVQVPAFTDKNRNRDFERDWDKDRYGARSSLSPHLATLGKWCSPLKRNSGRYIIGHSNINSRDSERTYVTSCYTKHVSMLPLALPKPFF